MMKMLAKKWNFSKVEYEDYELPEGASTFSKDMDEIVSCARCGKQLSFGDTYTSRQIQTQRLGFGYGVCKECYEEEWKAEWKEMERRNHEAD